ncbi:hypothetical protein E2C01_090568 [Portunus trituberculatus]|uniref:Uncharacterized protein n=1 Tax=Portunus trituberculatus TaxID=210409 RepID=A0A5B7JBQ9_PORTR|nr:hypothetical protein [Portunus trituberculatus]
MQLRVDLLTFRTCLTAGFSVDIKLSCATTSKIDGRFLAVIVM